MILTEVLLQYIAKQFYVMNDLKQFWLIDVLRN